MSGPSHLLGQLEAWAAGLSHELVVLRNTAELGADLYPWYDDAGRLTHEAHLAAVHHLEDLVLGDGVRVEAVAPLLVRLIGELQVLALAVELAERD